MGVAQLADAQFVFARFLGRLRDGTGVVVVIANELENCRRGWKQLQVNLWKVLCPTDQVELLRRRLHPAFVCMTLSGGKLITLDGQSYEMRRHYPQARTTRKVLY
jgi:hypothetical protein